MIRVKTVIGEFTLEDGKFTEGLADLEALFELYNEPTPSVWEGPLDFALADRMCKDLPGGYEILEEKHSDGDEGLVY